MDMFARCYYAGHSGFKAKVHYLPSFSVLILFDNFILNIYFWRFLVSSISSEMSLAGLPMISLIVHFTSQPYYTMRVSSEQSDHCLCCSQEEKNTTTFQRQGGMNEQDCWQNKSLICPFYSRFYAFLFIFQDIFRIFELFIYGATAQLKGW